MREFRGVAAVHIMHRCTIICHSCLSTLDNQMIKERNQIAGIFVHIVQKTSKKNLSNPSRLLVSGRNGPTGSPIGRSSSNHLGTRRRPGPDRPGPARGDAQALLFEPQKTTAASAAVAAAAPPSSESGRLITVAVRPS